MIVALLALVADAALLYLLKVNFSRVWVVTSWVGHRPPCHWSGAGQAGVERGSAPGGSRP